MKEFVKYSEIHQDQDLLRKFGVKIHVMFDDEGKDASFTLNTSEIIRVNN